MAARGFALGSEYGSYTHKRWWAYFYAEMLEMLETLEYEDEDEDMSDEDKVAKAKAYADGRVDKMRKASSANGSVLGSEYGSYTNEDWWAHFYAEKLQMLQTQEDMSYEDKVAKAKAYADGRVDKMRKASSAVGSEYRPCVGGDRVKPRTANNKKRKRNMSENGHNPDLRKPTSRPHVGDMTSTGEVFEAYKPKPANSVGGLSLKVILTMTWDGKTFTMEYTPSIGSDGRVKLNVPRNRYGEVGLSATLWIMIPKKKIDLAKKETTFWTKKEVFREKSEVASMEIKFVKL